jgi:hypothetical protein
MSSPLTILPLDHDPVWPPQVCGGCGARGATRDVSVRLLRVGEQSMAAMSFFRKQRRIAVPACATCAPIVQARDVLRRQQMFPMLSVAGLAVIAFVFVQSRGGSPLVAGLIAGVVFVLLMLHARSVRRAVAMLSLPLSHEIDGDSIRIAHANEEDAKRFAKENARVVKVVE